MNRIEGKGKPTRTTKGAVGDEYVDTDTRLRYKCTFAFCDSISNEFVYEWNQMRGNRINISPVDEEVPKEEVDKFLTSVASHTKPEKPAYNNNTSKGPKRTNYKQYAK